MEAKLIKISDLRESPIQRPILPKGFIERVRTFKQVLADVEKSSLEQAVNNFQRDMHPENELRTWEHIVEIYQSYIFENAITDLATKKEVLSAILEMSMGMEDFSNIKLLSKDQIENIIYRY